MTGVGAGAIHPCFAPQAKYILELDQNRIGTRLLHNPDYLPVDRATPGYIQIIAYPSLYLQTPRSIPTQDGIIIMGPGIGHTLIRIVLREMGVVPPAAETMLENPDSGISQLRKKRVGLLLNRRFQCLGNNREVSQFILHRSK